MAEKTNAKKKVGTATRKFDKILKSVKDRMSQNKEHSTGFLESISCDLSNTHADVEQKLESYRELLDSGDENDKTEVEKTDSELDKLQDDLTEVQILLEKLKVKEANSKKEKIKSNAKKKVGTATRKYHKVLKAVKEKMSQNKEHSSGFLESLSVEISSAYAEAESKLEEYRELLDSGDEEENSEINTTDGELDSIRDGITDVQIQLDQLKLNEASTVKSKKKEESASKMKRFDPPKFSGKLRDYPAFITHYETHVEQQHGKDTYALWNCLDDSAQKVVQPVIDDYDEMKERLRKKYGSSEKQVDSIIQQIKSLTRVADGDIEGLVHMIETVEMCWLDLKRLKLESEMNTTTMISEIERLLPTIQKREWTLQKPENADFMHLKDFLVKEKQAVEYMTEDIRSANKHTKSRVNFAGITEEEPVESANVIVNLLEKQLESHNQLMKIMTQTMAKVPTDKHIDISDRSSRSGVNYRCWLHKSNGHDTVECSSFAGMDNQEKVAVSRRNGACFCCLKTGHISRQCQEKIQCGEIDQNNQPCTRYHHKLLHAAHIDGQIFHNSVHVVNTDQNGSRNQAILMVSSLNIKGHCIGTLWDPGANTSLITHRAAQRLNLKGVDVYLTITKVGNERQSGPSKEYVIPVSDLQGKIWKIKAYGINEITDNVSPIPLHGIADLFENITEQDIQRPHGKIDILIASDCCRMLPDKVEEVRDLQLMKNQFGYCLRGSHPMIKLHTRESNHVLVKIHHLDADVKNANIDISINENTIHKNMEISVLDKIKQAGGVHEPVTNETEELESKLSEELEIASGQAEITEDIVHEEELSTPDNSSIIANQEPESVPRDDEVGYLYSSAMTDEKRAKIAEEARLAEEQRIVEAIAAEERRIAKEKDAEEQRIADEIAEEERRIAEEKRIADEKAAEEERLAREAEDQRIEAGKAAEEERLAKEAEEQRIAAEKDAEEERLAKEAEENIIAAELAAEAERLEKEAEEKRLADEKAGEEARLAKKAEDKRIAAVTQEAEEQRITAERAEEEQRMAEAKATEEARLAEEREALEKHLAEEKAAEEKRLAEEKAAEETRLAEEKAAEEKRLAEEKLAEEKRLSEELLAEKQRLAKELLDRQVAEKLPADAAESTELEDVLHSLTTELDELTTRAIAAQRRATPTTAEHNKRIKAAMVDDLEGSLDKSAQWEAVTSTHFKSKLKEVKESETMRKKSIDLLEKLNVAIKVGNESNVTKGTPALIPADEAALRMSHDLQADAAEQLKSMSDARVMEQYRNLVKKGRKQFMQEFQDIEPNLHVCYWDHLTTDELNLMIAHAYQRMDQLQAQVVAQQSLEQTRLDEALESQRLHGAEITRKAVGRQKEYSNSEHRIDINITRSA